MVALIGMKVKDGKKIEALVRDAARDAKDEKVEVKLDLEKTGDGTTIHRILGPVDENTRKRFGTPYVHFAFRDDLLIFALGEQGLKALKDGLESTKGRRGGSPQVELALAVSKLAAIASAVDAASAAEAARKAFKGPDAAKDSLRLSLQGEGEAVKLRLSMDVPAMKFFAYGLGVQTPVARSNP
jgi:hypothetical protein